MSRETKAAFARRLGVDRANVTRWAQEGRVVVVDGQVEVEASLARLEATRDPNRDDVRQRHAAARDAKRTVARREAGAGGISADGEGEGSGVVAPAVAAATAASAAAVESEPVIQAAEVFRKARAAKMHYEARRAVIRVARLNGRLAEVSTIRQCAGSDGATLRSMLENLPDQAAPRLAPVRDVAMAAAILGELLDDILATLVGLERKHHGAMRESEAQA